MPPPAARTPNTMVTYLDELNPTHTTPAPEYPTVRAYEHPWLAKLQILV